MKKVLLLITLCVGQQNFLKSSESAKQCNNNSFGYESPKLTAESQRKLRRVSFNDIPQVTQLPRQQSSSDEDNSPILPQEQENQTQTKVKKTVPTLDLQSAIAFLQKEKEKACLGLQPLETVDQSDDDSLSLLSPKHRRKRKENLTPPPAPKNQLPLLFPKSSFEKTK